MVLRGPEDRGYQLSEVVRYAGRPEVRVSDNGGQEGLVFLGEHPIALGFECAIHEGEATEEKDMRFVEAEGEYELAFFEKLKDLDDTFA